MFSSHGDNSTAPALILDIMLPMFSLETPALSLQDSPRPGQGSSGISSMLLLLCSVTWFACFSRWDFGDGMQETYLFKPPYNKSFLVPDRSVHEVVLEHNVSHVYQDPGMLRMVLGRKKGLRHFWARSCCASMSSRLVFSCSFPMQENMPWWFLCQTSLRTSPT